MIKVVNLVALLAAPLVVTVEATSNGQPNLVVLISMAILLAVIIWAILRSKKGDSEADDLIENISKTKA